MKVSVVRGGGVAGLTSRVRLAAAALPGEDAKALEGRVRESRLLTMPEPPRPPTSHADQLLYAVSVDDGENERTLQFSDETMPEEVRSLIEWVDSHPKGEREVLPPG
jgi:hypothetical protein